MYLEVKITGTKESFGLEFDNAENFGELLEVIAMELEKLCPPQMLKLKFRLSLDGKNPLLVMNDDVSAASLGIDQIVHVLAEQHIVDVINGESPRKKIAFEGDESETSQSVLECETKEENDVKRLNANDESYYDKVSLIREVEGEDFPASLMDEFEKSSVSNDFQALLAVIRVLMKEEGFTIQEITDQKNSSVKIDFVYESATCKFVINLIEDSIIIYAIYSRFIRFSVVLISSFIRRKPFDSFSPRNYHQLPALSLRFKNDVVLPLMAEMKRDLGIFDHLRLNNLPVIVLMEVMKKLGEKDLLSLSCTCSTLHRLGNDDVLWRRLFALKGLKETTQLPEELDDEDEEGWKSKYRREVAAAAARKAAKMKEARARERSIFRLRRNRCMADRSREHMLFRMQPNLNANPFHALPPPPAPHLYLD